MKAPSLLLIGTNVEARAAITDAALLAFPTAGALQEAASVRDALAKSLAAETELLLLAEPEQAELAEAVSALDAWGLPRWAVVVFGGCGTEEIKVATVLARDGWDVRAAAPVLRSAAREHILRRENARLRGDLATVGRRISHDLRTPLAAIYTGCEALTEAAGTDAEDYPVFTQSIKTSANELADLIERVSAIAKASSQSERPERVPMGEAVFITLQRLESSIRRSGAALFQPQTWPTVDGVGTWLETIWLELIANALRHTPAPPQVDLGWDQTADNFRFWVKDRGTGVAPEKSGKLYYPFHALHRLNAPRGLGLPLVQRLVELQGGNCGYEPRVGGGSHFFFTLPRAPSP